MSPLKVETLHREFFYNGTRVPDPAPAMSVEQVRIVNPLFSGTRHRHA
jgi:PRTRC genetic system protein C